MAATLEHWYEWKERCAINLCDPETKAALIASLTRLAWQKRRVAKNEGLFNPEEAPGIFDTFCSLVNRNTQKPHKDWMMQVLDLPEQDEKEKLSLCRQRVSAQMNNALEHFLRGENNFWKQEKALPTSSLNKTANGKDVSVQDYLLEKSQEFLRERPLDQGFGAHQTATVSEEEEYLEQAQNIIYEMIEAFDLKYLQVCLAGSMGLPFTDERLQDICDAAQGTLYDRKKTALLKLKGIIEEKFPEDGSREHFYLATITMKVFVETLITADPLPEWAKPILNLSGPLGE